MAKTDRGTCGVCGYRWRLLRANHRGVRDVAAHWVYVGSVKHPCDGSRLPCVEDREKDKREG